MRYKILFYLSLLSDYYKNSISLDFDFIPSDETASLLKRYRLLSKGIGNKLIVLTKVDHTGVPITSIDPDVKFVFYLSLKNPCFINFNNIDFNLLKDKRFYFTNLNQNKANNILNITLKIANYDNTKPYSPGDLVNNGSGTIFECIKNTTGNNTTVSDYWASKENNQFVSPADMIKLSSKILNYKAPAAAKVFKVDIYSLNKVSGDYTEKIKSETQTFVNAVEDIQLDLSLVKSGKYRITINADELLLYIDDSFIYNNYFGVVEIFSHLPNTNEFSFFEKITQYNAATSYVPGDLADDGTSKIFECIQATTGNNTSNTNFWMLRENVPGKLKEINYTTRFANRMVIWKYSVKTNDITAVNDSSSTYTFSQLAPLVYVSNRPIPVSQTPVKTLFLKSTLLDKIKPLVNPDVSRLNTIKLNGSNFFCAEVNLNY